VRALFNTDRAAEKSAIYGIIETRFFEGKKGKFERRIELIDATVASCRIKLRGEA